MIKMNNRRVKKILRCKDISLFRNANCKIAVTPILGGWVTKMRSSFIWEGIYKRYSLKRSDFKITSGTETPQNQTLYWLC